MRIILLSYKIWRCEKIWAKRKKSSDSALGNCGGEIERITISDAFRRRANAGTIATSRDNCNCSIARAHPFPPGLPGAGDGVGGNSGLIVVLLSPVDGYYYIIYFLRGPYYHNTRRSRLLFRTLFRETVFHGPRNPRRDDAFAYCGWNARIPDGASAVGTPYDNTPSICSWCTASNYYY